MDLGSAFGTLGFKYDDGDLRKAERDMLGYGATADKTGGALRDLAGDSDKSGSALTSLASDSGKAQQGLRDTADASKAAGDAMDTASAKSGGLSSALAGLAGQGEGALGSFLSKAGELDVFGQGLGDLAGKAGDLIPALAGGGGLSGAMGTLLGSINPVTVAAAAAGIALLKMAEVGIGAANDMNAAQRQAQAQFGLTAAEAEALGEVGATVFANNWAGSIEEATIRAGGLRQVLGEMAAGELQAVTESSAAFETVFGKGLEDQQRALQSLVGNFEDLGGSGAAALDLLTVGFQNGLNSQDDLIDTANEYSNLFVEMGFSSSQFFGILKQGLDAGARDTDKVADLFKEFEIRIKDGSDSTKEALSQLGLDTELSAQVARGEVAFDDAFNMIQARLGEVSGDVAETAMVGLFGTLSEDTGSIIQGIDLATAGLDVMGGAALEAGNATLTIGDSIQSIKNTGAIILGGLFEPLVDAIASRVKPWLDDLQVSLLSFKETDSFTLLTAYANYLGDALGVILDIAGLVGDVFLFQWKVAAGAAEALASGVVSVGQTFGFFKDETEAAGVAQEKAGAQIDANTGALIDQSMAAAQAAEAERGAAEAAAEHAKALEDANGALNDRVHGALSDLRTTQLSYASDIQAARAADAAAAAEMGQKVVDGEAEHVEKMAALQEKLHNSEGKAQAKAAEQIAAEEERWAGIVGAAETGASSAVAEVERRYDEERAAVRESLAQTVVDHTNAMVLMGEVSEETAKSVFQALASAYPDVEVINPATEATLEFNATLNDVLSGERDASAIVDAIDNVETSMLDLEAQNSEMLGIDPAFERLGLSSEEMAARIGASSTAVGDSVEESEERLGSAHAGIRDEMAESGAAGALLADEMDGSGKAVVDGQARAAAGVRDAQASIRTEMLSTESASAGTASGIVNNLSGIGQAITTDKFSGLLALETNLQAAGQQAGTTARSLAELNAAAAEIEKPAAEGGSAFDRASRDIQAGAAQGTRSIGDTKQATEALAKAIEDIPPDIEVDMSALIKQLDLGHTGLRRLILDIQAARAEGVAGVPIRAWIQAGSPGADDGGSIMYQHFIQDARAEGEKGIGIRTWLDGTDALDEALDLLDYARELEDLIDRQQDGIEEANRLLGEATRRAEDYARQFTATVSEILSAGALQAALGGASGGIGGAIDLFLIDPKFEQVLDRIPEAASLLNGLRDTFSMDRVFDTVQILDPDTLLPFESLEQFQAKMRELAGEPERQRELWDQFKEVAGSAFEAAGARAIDALEQFKNDIGPDGIDPLREGIEGLSNEVASQINRWAEELTEQFGEQLDLVDAQAEVYDRLLDLVEERRRIEEQLRKELEQQIKEQERVQLDAQRRVHDLAMKALDQEADRQERLHDQRMENHDRRLKAEKDALSAAEKEHKRRLDMIGEEERRLQERYGAEGRFLSDVKDAIGALEDGFELTDYERSALVAMGFDPDELAAAVAETEKLQEAAEGLKKLLSDLPDNPRERVTKEKLTGAQRDELQKALDEGALAGRDKRLVEVLLASSGGIATAELRRILDEVLKVNEDSGTGGGDATDPLQAVKDRIALRDREQQILKHGIDAEKRANEALRDAEDARWETERAAHAGRIAAIEAEKSAEEDRYERARDALKDQMDLQKEAHDERMRQIQEQYALELLKLGKTEEEVLAHLENQRELARQIAAEAAQRAADAIAAAEEAARIAASYVGLPGGVATPPGAPGIPIPVPPPPGSTTDSTGGLATDYPGSMSQTNAELEQMINLSLRASSAMAGLRESLAGAGLSGGDAAGSSSTFNQKTNSDNTVTLYGNVISTDPEGRALIERMLEALGR